MKSYEWLKECLKYVGTGVGGFLTLHLLAVLVVWFISFEFPWEMVQFGTHWRGTLVCVVFVSVFFWWMAYEDKKETKRIREYLAAYYKEHGRYPDIPKPRYVSRTPPRRSKSPSVLDIAVGVGTGMVLGDIVSDVLDVGED